MAWQKNDNWKWQLRDRKGRWIEMGRGVKWYSRELGREVSGTVVGQRGKDAIVSLTSEPNDPKTGKPIQKAVKGSDIEVISSKATLGKPAGEPAKPAAPAEPAAPKAIVNKAEAPVAKKYNDAGLTADEQKAVDFQEKKAKQAADKGDLDAADRYEAAAAKTRKIGEDRIKNGEGDTPAEDIDDAEETQAPAPAKSIKAPTRNADIERDLGLLEQEAEDIESLSDPDEKASALEAAQYDLTNDAGDTVSMRLVAGADEGSYDVAVEDANGKELGRVPMPESGGERIDTAKAVRELANGRTPAKAEISEEPAEEPVEAPEAEEAPETPETAPEAPEAAPEAYKKQGFKRELYDARAKKAFADEIAAKGDESGWKMNGSEIEVTDPVKAIETARKLSVVANKTASDASGKSSKVALHATQRELTAVARITAEQHPQEAKQARDGYTVAAENNESTSAPEAKAEKPLLNGEEGYVPVDGRGAKTAKEAPKAAATPSEDPLEAIGVQRTEPVALPGEKFPPTRQQQDIIDAVLAGKNTAVQAKAGTGKTTTLEALAKRVGVQDPNKKIAYIAFNKTVQTEAEGRMPGNVEARTGHSIAFHWASPEMQKRSNDPNAIRRADEIAAYLGIKNTVRTDGADPLSPKEQAMAATRTVDAYANSAEDKIEASHLPKNVQELGPEAQQAVLDAANKIWEDVQKPQGSLKFTLDHMRKLWALSRPDFTKPGSGLKRPAQLIFMDESQDTPPVLARVMDEQTAQKVVVGDSDQNIYSSFTGSIDYMSQTQKDVELPLTKSWRFGPEVADIGNRFLQLVKSQGRVEGGGKSAIVENMQDADAILVRSNAGMVDEAFKELEKGRTVGVPKDTKKDLNSMINSVAYLMGKGDAPTRMHDDLAAYRNWEEVLAEAEKGDATAKKISGLVSRNGLGGLRSIVSQLVEGGDGVMVGVTYNDMPHGRVAEGKTFENWKHLQAAGFKLLPIPGAPPMKSGKNKGQPRKGWTAVGTPEQRDEMVARANAIADGSAVDVTIATAHKSKGLEWDKVKIGDDFRGPTVNETTGEVDMPKPEELRLAYVATTRAKKELDPGSLGYVFEYTDENGGVPEAPDNNEENNDPEEDRGTPTSTVADEENSDTTTDEDQPTEEPADVPEEAPSPEEDAPNARPEDDASREEAERINRENEEVPVAEETPTPEEPEVAPEAAPTAPEEPAEAPAPEEPSQGVPEGATETPDGTPVASEETVPEDEQQPEPEPEETVPDPEVVPEPQELPKKEAPEPAPTPAEPEETTAPAPEEAPTGGTAPPEPDSRPLHPVKAKAANYPDGTIIRDTRTGESIEKTNGNWHVAGDTNTPADPMDVASPFVYDMPKQADDSFSPFEGIDSVGPGDILVTRKGTQVAVVGKRDGKLVVAPHNQTDEWRKSRPSLATIPPETVKGVNKFETPAAPKQGDAPAKERKRTPFSSNRGNSNVTITDVGGNVIKVGDTVRTEMGTGKVVRVRPSDGPNGSAFVEFEDGTIKSFRSNKMRNTAFAEDTTGGDDPSKMDIGAVGEAADGRQFMVGKGNKPIFKGSRIALADGREGTVSGFAKGVQSVNLKMDDGSTPRKKASVVDVTDYTAPESSPEDTTPEAPAPTPEAEAPATPEAEPTPEPEAPEPAVINDPKETPEEREERIAAATSNAKDPAFLSSWWNIVMKDDMNESDIYAIDTEMQGRMESLFNGEMARDEHGILAAKGWGLAAWLATKDTNRSPEEQEKMRELQTRITQFVQQQELRMSEDAKEKAAKTGGPVRKPDGTTPNENQSLKSDRALRPEPALKGAELDAYAGIQTGAWSGDLFGENSKLNVTTGAKDLGNTQTITNRNGDVFREGVKVYNESGTYIGVVKDVRRGGSGGNDSPVTVSVRVGRNTPFGMDRVRYDANKLTTQATPPVWNKQEDLKFPVGSTSYDIARKMSEAYPGVTFDFNDLSDVPKRMREYAETVSKMLNKYPQLSAVLTSVSATEADKRLGTPFGWASTSDHNGLRDTKVAFNTKVRKKVVGGMQQGNSTGFFNNVPEGREMEYVVSHEFGHVLDYMTGNMTEIETYELMKELVPADVMGDKAKLGQWLYANGMVSEYSTKRNKVNAVELVAESFADVEINGASAKPISKLVHAELMKRIDEIAGGSGVIPQAPAV